MSRFKAMTPWDLTILVFVLMFCAGTLFVMYYSNIVNITKSAYNIDYSNDLIDTGSEVVSILSHMNNGIVNMDLLGRKTGMNSGNHMDSDIGDTLENVYSSYITYDMMLDYEIGFLLRYGESKTGSECGIQIPADFLEDGKPKFTLSWPGDRPPSDPGVITSLQGPRYIFDHCNCHPGMDFGFNLGSPIYAAYSGIVEYADWHVDSKQDHTKSYGLFIRIKHWIGVEDREDIPNENNPDFYTYYGHLENPLLVEEGDWILAGEQIASCGNTGRSTGPHLHLELRDDNYNFMNPCPFFEEKPVECDYFTEERPTFCGNYNEAEKVTFDVPVPGAIIRSGSAKTNAVGVLYKWA